MLHLTFCVQTQFNIYIIFRLHVATYLRRAAVKCEQGCSGSVKLFLKHEQSLAAFLLLMHKVALYDRKRSTRITQQMFKTKRW